MNGADNPLLNSTQVRQIFGGISDMSLWRWVKDENLGFPAPVYIQRRRFWSADDIAKFRERLAEKSAGTAPVPVPVPATETGRAA